MGTHSLPFNMRIQAVLMLLLHCVSASDQELRMKIVGKIAEVINEIAAGDLSFPASSDNSGNEGETEVADGGEENEESDDEASGDEKASGDEESDGEEASGDEEASGGEESDAEASGDDKKRRMRRNR